MSRLSGRRNFDGASAAAFQARSRHPFTAQWRFNVRKWTQSQDLDLYQDLPVTGGTLTMDSSADVRRTLVIDVADSDLTPADESSILVPFGQRIIAWVRIDLPDGTWSPWLAMGEYPIVEVVVERPAGIVTVRCEDFSAIINEYLFLNPRSFKGMSVYDVAKNLAESALPNNLFTIHADDRARTRKFVNFTADPAARRWDTLLEGARRKGCEAFFDSDGNLVVRKDRTDDDEDTIPGAGPDIGQVSNPVATIDDGTQGVIIALTGTVSRRGGVNGVRYNLQNPSAGGSDDIDYKAEALQLDGPVAWGNEFGHLPLVSNESVGRITTSLKAQWDEKAKAMLRRRRGVVRYLDLDCHPQYWVEPDDIVQVAWGGREEFHYAQAVTFDVSGRRPMRLRTRQLSVTEVT